MKNSGALWVVLAFCAGNAIAAPPSTTPPPSTLSDAQVSLAIWNTRLRDLAEKRTYISCGWIQQLSAGTPLDPSAPTNYDIWLHYVADHIRSGTPFGADYAQLAAGALADVPHGFGEVCLSGPPKDLQKLAVVENANPAKIGQGLFAAFRACDQNTRNRAATKIEQ